MTRLINQIRQDALSVLRPPPKLSVSQWADVYRRLSSEASAEPGKWLTARAAYQAGPMDALNDPEVEQLVIMSSAQVGKTEILLNAIGFFIDQDPSPILTVQPTLEMAQAFSKDRLAPMVRDTPILRSKLKDPRSRDSGNTMLHKTYPGGHITISGANSPASLASRPIRIVLADEVDRFPPSAAAEGDPVNLAKKRTTTFWNRKIVLTSTPTLKGFSRIEMAYEQSDQRIYLVPCQHCGEEQRLTWDLVKWPDGKPSDAAIACKNCGVLWTESERQMSISAGRWHARKEFNGIAGFHLSELYSPWSTPAKIAKAFLEAKNAGPELLKTWVNTSLGESWEEAGETIEHHALMARCEDWGDTIPNDIVILTMGCDVQVDRIELEVVGWGKSQESWSVDYEILFGDPTKDQVWTDLAAMIRSTYLTADNRQLSPAIVMIDSGFLPERVYRFCQSIARTVIPVKGVSGVGKPVVEKGIKRVRRQIKNRASNDIKPELIGVDEAKSIIYRQLQVDQPGPGYAHFPNERDEEYFLQLTAEKRVLRYKKGVPFPEWIAERPRNEALDCRVYAYAAFVYYGPERVNVPRETNKVGETWTISKPNRRQKMVIR